MVDACGRSADVSTEIRRLIRWAAKRRAHRFSDSLNNRYHDRVPKLPIGLRVRDDDLE